MSLSKRYLLGMDLGTTNVKGIIMDEDGNIVASASRANELILPGPGMAEQDAGLWWEHSAAIMRELTQKAGAAIVDQICGVCISVCPVGEDLKRYRGTELVTEGGTGHCRRYGS